MNGRESGMTAEYRAAGDVVLSQGLASVTKSLNLLERVPFGVVVEMGATKHSTLALRKPNEMKR